MENSAVDFYNQEIKELFNQFQDGEISGNMFHVLRLTALTKAKDLQKQQIKEAFKNGDCNGTFETINAEQYYTRNIHY